MVAASLCAECPANGRTDCVEPDCRTRNAEVTGCYKSSQRKMECQTAGGVSYTEGKTATPSKTANDSVQEQVYWSQLECKERGTDSGGRK